MDLFGPPPGVLGARRCEIRTGLVQRNLVPSRLRLMPAGVFFCLFRFCFCTLYPNTLFLKTFLLMVVLWLRVDPERNW